MGQNAVKDKMFLEISVSTEFLTWAYKEPEKYWRSGNALDRMNGWPYVAIASEWNPARHLSTRGGHPIVLDRAECVGWRFVDARGSSRTPWSVAPDRHRAVSDAYTVATDMERDNRFGTPYTDAVGFGRVRLYTPVAVSLANAATPEEPDELKMAAAPAFG